MLRCDEMIINQATSRTVARRAGGGGAGCCGQSPGPRPPLPPPLPIRRRRPPPTAASGGRTPRCRGCCWARRRHAACCCSAAALARALPQPPRAPGRAGPTQIGRWRSCRSGSGRSISRMMARCSIDQRMHTHTCSYTHLGSPRRAAVGVGGKVWRRGRDVAPAPAHAAAAARCLPLLASLDRGSRK